MKNKVIFSKLSYVIEKNSVVHAHLEKAKLQNCSLSLSPVKQHIISKFYCFFRKLLHIFGVLFYFSA